MNGVVHDLIEKSPDLLPLRQSCIDVTVGDYLGIRAERRKGNVGWKTVDRGERIIAGGSDRSSFQPPLCMPGLPPFGRSSGCLVPDGVSAILGELIE